MRINSIYNERCILAQLTMHHVFSPVQFFLLPFVARTITISGMKIPRTWLIRSREQDNILSAALIKGQTWSPRSGRSSWSWRSYLAAFSSQLSSKIRSKGWTVSLWGTTRTTGMRSQPFTITIRLWRWSISERITNCTTATWSKCSECLGTKF